MSAISPQRVQDAHSALKLVENAMRETSTELRNIERIPAPSRPMLPATDSLRRAHRKLDDARDWFNTVGLSGMSFMATIAPATIMALHGVNLLVDGLVATGIPIALVAKKLHTIKNAKASVATAEKAVEAEKPAIQAYEEKLAHWRANDRSVVKATELGRVAEALELTADYDVKGALAYQLDRFARSVYHEADGVSDGAHALLTQWSEAGRSAIPDDVWFATLLDDVHANSSRAIASRLYALSSSDRKTMAAFLFDHFFDGTPGKVRGNAHDVAGLRAMLVEAQSA